MPSITAHGMSLVDRNLNSSMPNTQNSPLTQSSWLNYRDILLADLDQRALGASYTFNLPLNKVPHALHEPLKTTAQWLKQSTDIEFLGFVGSHELCQFQIDTDKHGFDPFDSIVYRHHGLMYMQRIAHTSECDDDSLLPYDIYSKPQQQMDRVAAALANEQNPEIKKTSAVAFKADGPDDMASLAKETVEGVAQPLVHLGVLGLFYPFVAMGAKGLREDYVELLEDKTALQETINTLETELIQTAQDLPQYQLPTLNAGSNASQRRAICQQVAACLKQNPQDTALAEYFKSVLELGFLVEGLHNLKRDVPEAWSAQLGMRGMKHAMQLFCVESVASLASITTQAQASTAFAAIGAGVGAIGTGLMGGAQFLMMISGLCKAGNGVKQCHDMRSKASHVSLDKLNNINFEQSSKLESKQLTAQSLRDYQQDLKREGRLNLARLALPGISLSIGQALMLAWSITSLAAVFSGVGAPVGIGMMLALLIPGVALTLASALPQVGLESIMNKFTDKRIGKHGQDDGFDATAYWFQLLLKQQSNQAAGDQVKPDSLLSSRNLEYLTQHAQQLQHKLTQLNQVMLNKNYDQQQLLAVFGLQRTNGPEQIIRLVEDLGQDESLQHQLQKKFGKKSALFDVARTIEYRPCPALLSFAAFKNPLGTLKSKCMRDKSLQPKVVETLSLNAKQLRNQEYVASIEQLGLQEVADYGVKRLRAALRATQEGLDQIVKVQTYAVV